MKFKPTKLPGVYIIELEKKQDKRGFFARTWCRKEFTLKGLNPEIRQCSLSFNKSKNTLRGMHYQIEPCSEDKIVSCVRGSLLDVVIDLRPESKTFMRHCQVMLSDSNFKSVYIPKGCAHGYLTRQDNTVVYYQIAQEYSPQYSRGIRWNDAAFNLKWPKGRKIISKKDRSYPDYQAG